MNAITNLPTGHDLTSGTLEQVLGHGNLKALSASQRVEYLVAVCKSRGLNPLTRPIRLMEFQGQVVPYATRDCADQLRKIEGVNIHVVSKGFEDDLYVVHVEAVDRHGRRDEDMGVVVAGQLKGEAKANAMLKAITKAKRRVTLSICGLGILDETEVSDMRGAQPLDDGGRFTINARAEPAQTTAALLNDSIPALDDAPRPSPEEIARKMVSDLVGLFAMAEAESDVTALQTSPKTGKLRQRLRELGLSDLDASIQSAIDDAFVRLSGATIDADDMPEAAE